MEEWRRIDGWPYDVSNLGRVRRLTAKTCTKSGKILRPGLAGKGYPSVRLSRGGEIRTFLVHALVCAAFHGPQPFAGAEVRHLNGIKVDCTSVNLAWGTAADNAFDRMLHGTYDVGENHARSVLTNDRVRDIRNAYAAEKARRAAEGKKRVDNDFWPVLAASHGVNVDTVQTIGRGRGYPAGGVSLAIFG